MNVCTSFRILLISIGAHAFLTGCGGESDGKPAAGARRGGGATPVEALVIQTQPIENTIFTTGTLLANEEVELKPEISGRVTKVHFDEGASVKQGALLVKINDQELQAQLKRKQFEEKLAGDEERRARALFDAKGITQEEYDRVASKLDIVRAEEEVIESQLAKTEIRAPFDGTIGLRYISEGSVLAPGTLIATMQDTDPIKVEFSIPEKYAGLLTPGTPITLQVTENRETYQGSVYAVEAKVDPATRTLKARATAPNPKGVLIPGAFAKVEITVERIADAVVIPAEALIPELEGEKVFVYDNGTARSVRVATGIRSERTVQITSGLKANDTLILTGLMQLDDGKPVELRINPAPEAKP